LLVLLEGVDRFDIAAIGQVGKMIDAYIDTGHPAVAITHPSELGQEEAAVDLLGLDLFRIGTVKAVIAPFAFKSWKVNTLGEEVFVRPLEGFKGLLQRVAGGILEAETYPLRCTRQSAALPLPHTHLTCFKRCDFLFAASAPCFEHSTGCCRQNGPICTVARRLASVFVLVGLEPNMGKLKCRL
jgi:hypothetical protein